MTTQENTQIQYTKKIIIAHRIDTIRLAQTKAEQRSVHISFPPLSETFDANNGRVYANSKTK